MLIPLESPVPITVPDFSAITALAFAAPSDAAPACTTKTKPTGLSIDIAQCYPSPPLSRAPSHAGSGAEPTFAIKVVDASPPPEPLAFGVTDGGDWDGLVSPRRFTNSPAVEYNHCTGLCREDPFLCLSKEADKMEVDVVSCRWIVGIWVKADWRADMHLSIEGRRTLVGGRRGQVVDAGMCFFSCVCRSLGVAHNFLFLQYLVNNLMGDPRPTLRNLLTSVR